MSENVVIQNSILCYSYIFNKCLLNQCRFHHIFFQKLSKKRTLMCKTTVMALNIAESLLERNELRKWD